MRQYILRPLERLCFTTTIANDDQLFVKNEGSGIVMTARGDAIAALAPAFGPKIRSATNDGSRNGHKVILVQPSDEFRISLEDSPFPRACVHVTVEGGRFRLAGQADIVTDLYGDRLQRFLIRDRATLN